MEPPSDNAARCEALLASKKALFVGAHPDDIEFRAGGLVYMLRQRGAEVTFAIATRGGRSWKWPLRNVLERLRTRHQERAAQILGGADIVFFDHPDGGLAGCVEQFTSDLKSLIPSYQPDVILCWDPDYNLTPHPDHQAAALAVRDASRDPSTSSGCGTLTCWYGTAQPDLWVGFGEEAMLAKMRALKAHRTETPWPYFDHGLKKRMIAAMRAEGAKVAYEYAETFRCLPISLD